MLKLKLSKQIIDTTKKKGEELKLDGVGPVDYRPSTV